MGGERGMRAGRRGPQHGRGALWCAQGRYAVPPCSPRVGLELMGCPRGSGKQLTVQGVIYIVTAIAEDALELQMRPEYCHGA